MELDYFLRSDLRPIWSEVGSCMVDSVGLIAPASQPPLLCYGVLPVPMRGPPPWWAGNPLPRHWQGTTTRAFSAYPPRAPPLGASFLLHLLIEFAASRATNSPLTSAFVVGAAGVEPAASAL